MSVVYALATPAAKSAICIFRVSGDGCFDDIAGLFGLDGFNPRTFYLVDMKNGGRLVDRLSLIHI